MATKPVAEEQARLRKDMEIVRAYAVAHPEDWADIRWVNEPTVAVVARFVDNIPQHRQALRDQVGNPECLRVERAPYTDAQIRQVGTEIRKATREERSMRSCGPGDGRFRCRLQGGAVTFAEQLHKRYGDLVELTVGVLPYPSTGAAHAPPSEPPVGDGSLPVEIALVLDEPTLPRGADGTARLHITNRGDTTLQFMTGVMSGWVYRAGGDRPVSACSQARTLQGIHVGLSPGETSTVVPVLFSTDSYDPAVGYALPPGRYEVLGVLGYSAGIRSDRQTVARHTMHSNRAPLILT